jgi:hypothetical protein
MEVVVEEATTTTRTTTSRACYIEYSSGMFTGYKRKCLPSLYYPRGVAYQNNSGGGAFEEDAPPTSRAALHGEFEKDPFCFVKASVSRRKKRLHNRPASIVVNF